MNTIGDQKITDVGEVLEKLETLHTVKRFFTGLDLIGNHFNKGYFSWDIWSSQIHRNIKENNAC